MSDPSDYDEDVHRDDEEEDEDDEEEHIAVDFNSKDGIYIICFSIIKL